jgi:hypothetical protein
MPTTLPSKDPNNVEPYFVIWCDKETGLNDGSKNDHGELQGATILTTEWFIPEIEIPELVKKSSNQDAVTISGIDYDVDTVCTIWLTGGIDNKDYRLICRITTSDERTLDKTIVIPVKEG